jgi:hypothetical protein
MSLFWRLILCVWMVLVANASVFAETKQPIYYEAYPCDEGNASSTCIVGTLSSKADLTLVMKDRALDARPIRELPDQLFPYEKRTTTLVQASSPLLPKARILAIEAPAGTVSIIKQVDESDAALVQRVESYIQDMNAKAIPDEPLHHRWLNPHAETHVQRLVDDFRIAQVTVTYDDEVIESVTNRVRVECLQCAEEHITFVAYGSDLFELFQRKDQTLCSEVNSAFRLNGQVQLFASAMGCDNGGYLAKVFDLSEFPPREIFSSDFFSD